VEIGASLAGFGAPISDPARFWMFRLQAGSETGAPGSFKMRSSGSLTNNSVEDVHRKFI